MATIAKVCTVTLTDTAFENNSRQVTHNETLTWADGEIIAEFWQAIGTTHELLGVPASIDGAGGMMIVQNLDDTNFVEIGRDVSSTFYPAYRVPPLKTAHVYVPSSYATLYAKADTAECNVRVIATKA